MSRNDKHSHRPTGPSQRMTPVLANDVVSAQKAL